MLDILGEVLEENHFEKGTMSEMLLMSVELEYNGIVGILYQNLNHYRSAYTMHTLATNLDIIPQDKICTRS